MFSIIQAYTNWTNGDHQNKWIDNTWEYSIADKKWNLMDNKYLRQKYEFGTKIVG